MRLLTNLGARAAMRGAACLLLATLGAAEDAYERYVTSSRDFQPVDQERTRSYKAWPSWTYMPWYYQWNIGFSEAGGRFCQEIGYNGGFVDHGRTDNLAWLNQYQLRFYVDHLAGKGDLYLRDSNKMKGKDFGPTRPVLLDEALKAKLQGLIKQRVENVKSSPMRAAYALDDEPSWGSFRKPCMWQITDEANYRRWLVEKYGAGKAPAHPGWTSYNDLLPRLPGFTLGTMDASQLMDQWSFNDSWWNNFLGDLATYSNTIDPQTPVGVVGGQSPSPFGGWDYAKIMRKVQFAEFYWTPDEQCILQSFNRNQIPIVSSHFHQNARDSRWQFFTCLAHGNRGHIGWVEKWFDGNEPKPFHKELSPTIIELAQRLGPMQAQSTPVRDGVIIYYSHSSIQMGWILDAQSHGKTWVNRNADTKLGTYHLARRAWVNMLRDEGLQPEFLSYVDLIQSGIPKHCKTLILSSVYCLSDVEAARIRAFCKAGGTVIADFLPGVFDQDGKGRPSGGALDDVFKVRHDPGTKPADLYQGRDDLWVEANQDAKYTCKNTAELLADNACIKDESGFNKVVRSLPVATSSACGSGRAILMNLSPAWYLVHREAGPVEAKRRQAFMRHVVAADAQRPVRVEEAEKAFGHEIIRWRKDGRILLFLVGNLDVSGSMEGGGNAVGLKDGAVDLTLVFATPVTGVKDERTGKPLPDGQRFPVRWKLDEAVVLSYADPEARKR